MDREQRVCPACGQHVQSVIRRHKTLGAWVPRWVPGPCHNPQCEAYVEEGSRHDVPEPASEPDEEPGAPTARTS